MNTDSALLTVCVIAFLLAPFARAEKVFFRDELTGAEMWQLTRFQSTHIYSNAYRPFSSDGRLICATRSGGRAYVLDLFDGDVALLGSAREGARSPFFLFGRDRPGVIYFAGRIGSVGGTIHRHWLDTGEEKVVGKLPLDVNYLFNAGEGLIGPKSEYVPLCGDLNGDGLSDFGLLPLWEEGPPIILLTSPTAAFAGKTVCPTPERNLVGLTKVNCHPDILRRVAAGEKMNIRQCWVNAKLESYIVRVDFKTCKAELFPVKRARFLTHEAFSGDGKLMCRGGLGVVWAWKTTPPGSGLPFLIGDLNWRIHGGNHWGTCGLDGRYLVADTGYNGMEQLMTLDLWTGEASLPIHIGTPTRPVSRISQDHGHPGGSPDGTKVIAHSCYDLVRHRLYGVPTEDVLPGAAVIPVETTEGFAPSGRLLVRHGYNRNDLVVSYKRKDVTHFLGCDWGEDMAARLKKATGKDKIAKGSHVISDLDGRLFPDGRLRPKKEYIAVVRNPAPPRATSVDLGGAAARIRWLPPARCIETAGYAVYRQLGTRPPERLNETLLTTCEFIDKAVPKGGNARYWVRAVERSGLYGDWSAPVGVTNRAPQTVVLDAYDMPGTTYLEPGDMPESDQRKVVFDIPAAGTHTVWVRCQAPFGAETFGITLDGKGVGEMTVTEPEWHWGKVGSWQLAAGGHELALSRSVEYEISAVNVIGNPGFEKGLDGWVTPGGITSLDTTAPHSGGKCLKMEGNLTGTELYQRVKMKVKPNRYYRLSFWVRAVFTKAGSSSRSGKHPHTSGAFWVNAEPLRDPVDRIIYGDRFEATRWRHIVREVHAWPGMDVTKIKVRPFLSHPSWGEQEGTVWIDDVEFVELGPRKRLVKATKLLVTSVDGYVPEGKDGREAYVFPTLPVIPVAGLRQTGATRNTISLKWNAARPGARGFNVYVNVGKECPVTKYFRRATVWGANSALIEGLEYGRSHTIKVAALNEDGAEGSAATMRARTADIPPETHTAPAAKLPAKAPLGLKTEEGVTYLVTPKDPDERKAVHDRNGEGLPTDSCKFGFTISEEGDYLIGGRLFAANGSSNSFFFSLDGTEEFQWSVPSWAFNNWTWLMPREGKRWHLKQGKHTITMRTRESGTRLEQIVVTNDLRPQPPAARSTRANTEVR